MYEFFIEKLNLFSICILIWASFGDVLDIENQVYSIEKSKTYNLLFDFKLDLLIEAPIFGFKNAKKTWGDYDHITAKRSRLNDNLEIALAIF